MEPKQNLSKLAVVYTAQIEATKKELLKNYNYYSQSVIPQKRSNHNLQPNRNTV